jgi:hypothetical protein
MKRGGVRALGCWPPAWAKGACMFALHAPAVGKPTSRKAAGWFR